MDKIQVINLVPKFLDFYSKANKKELSNEERWALWTEHYNFAAVPPTEDGKKMARKIFENAWEKYYHHIDQIQNWQPDEASLRFFLTKVKSLLGCKETIDLVVLYFVGGFENNAFVAPFDKERLALCLPIENGNSDITLAHELTHIVHGKTANFSAQWERTIASIILQEGLATQVSKLMVPGNPDKDYVEHKEGWFETCNSKKGEIIKGILPHLEEASSEAVYKFTMGLGTTNNEREAYLVGWEVVKSLLEQGESFEKLANIKEKDIPEYIGWNLSKII